MAAIGSVTVTTMVGAPAPTAQAADAYARIGSDRIDRRQIGSRPVASVIETTTLVTGAGLAAAADAARDARAALKSTLQTVTDAHGTEHANTFIADVNVAAARKVRYNGAEAILLRTTWVVEGS